METGGNDVILTKAMKDLMAQWERSGVHWHDAARADFERDHLRDLAPSVLAAATAIQKIEEIVRRVRKECS
ncbi:MAG: hypothetical protein HYY18_08075 [Planctomycetes bacterium]|nr:hypothetical protein [Planctomycetota bacterium]